MTKLSPKTVQNIYYILLAVCLLPFMEPAYALLAGIILSLLGLKHPKMSSLTSVVLQGAIVLMGFGMDLDRAIAASSKGVYITIFSVIGTLAIGILLAKLLKIDNKIGTLISAGTAICGGSAIAAVAPVIKAKNYQISVSLVVIFILNAIALFAFPAIGHHLGMTQDQFGYWAAIAIHDTSSVVGAGAHYGPHALEVATAVKLTRALWIIPVSLFFAVIYTKKGEGKSKVKIPWFIAFFVVAILVGHYFDQPSMQATFSHLSWMGNRGMVMALFLIGSNISIDECKQAGAKSFVLGVGLWFIIAGLSLWAIMSGMFV